MDYLDFEIRIGDGSGGNYPVAVVNSPVIKPSATTSVPIGDPVFQNYLQALAAARSDTPRTAGMALAPAAGPPPPAAFKQFGRSLFDILLPGEVRTAYRMTLAKAREQGKGVRLRLSVESPELAAVPWEYLYDPNEGDYVCLSTETPITRYLEVGRAPQPLAVAPPLRVLGMVVSPHDLPPLNVEREKQQLAAAAGHLIDAGYVSIEWLPGQTWADLQAAMTRGPWHIFHFVGHGMFDQAEGEGQLALASPDGYQDLLSATHLGRLFAGHASLRLAILNACEGGRTGGPDLFSSIGASLIRRGIPAVISMQYQISDQAALEFSRALYDSLAKGLPVDASVVESRKSVSLAFRNSLEWGTPVLHMRAPDGRLFNLDVAAAIFPPGAAASALPAAIPRANDAPAVPVAPAATDEARRGLQILMRKVQQFWVHGVLEQSVHNATLFDLGMDLVQGAVDNPWGAILERPGADAQPLPPGQALRDVFDEQGGSLLILGEPGAGKTTSLLGLGRDLIERAEQDPTLPVPVVFNLSAWRDGRQNLADWLVDELSGKYQIPKAIGRGWVKEDRLLLLLDGLDEVAAERRATCVEAINAFLGEGRLVNALVACRLKEYMSLPRRLKLNSAVRLQPLTDDQVNAAVAAAGPRLAALQALLQRDSALRIDARSPLMLSLMMRTYMDVPVTEVSGRGFVTTDARRQQLMAAYVARMFRRAGMGGAYG